MGIIIYGLVFDGPPKFPIYSSEFPAYKKDLLRWSRNSKLSSREQSDDVLSSIPWEHTWKHYVEGAVGRGPVKFSDLLNILDACYELSVLKRIQRAGVKPIIDNGCDLLYSCNLTK